MQPQELVLAVLGAWRKIVVTAGALAVLVVAVAFFSDRRYTSAASFVPNAGGGLSQIAGLASQFGVALPGDAGGLSPEFYADFVRSGVVLKWVISSDTAWGTTPIEVDPVVAEGLEVTDSDPAMRQWRAVRKVRETITSGADPISGLVRIEVTTTSATLSKDLAERLLTAVERFNATSRQQQARRDTEFSEERLAEARRDLQDTEGRLAAFLTRNRSWSSSATLTLEYEGITRDVGFARSVYAALLQAAEQSRMESLRKAPMITRVESPVVAGVPDRRNSIFKGGIAFIAGLVLSTGVVVGLTLARAVGREYPELRSAWERMIGEVRATLRLGRRPDATA